MLARAVLVATLLSATSASAQLSRTTFGGLPRWADSALVAAGLGRQFTLSSQLNPVYAFGDFDGDALFDLAVEIKDTGGLRYGIAIVHRIDRSVHVVGAGEPVGNGKDQLSRRTSWGVSSPRHGRHRAVGRDVLYISQPGAHDGWLAWDDTAARPLGFPSVAPGVGGAQLTYVGKISGFHASSKANEAAI